MRKNREKEIVRRVDKQTVSISHGEKLTHDQFFRNEHPDERSNSQFLIDLKRLNKKKHEKKFD